MLARALPLLALALAAPLCGGEDPVAVLEEQKRELLAGTVEKKEFWAQVERKGAAAKRLQQLEGERAALEQELAGVEARRAGLEPGIGRAQEVNQRAGDVEAEIARRQEELDGHIRELESTLARWRAAGAPEGGT
jgi:hypothetical protein